MTRKVIVVNGPNLGRLGVREPDVYGHQDLETLRRDCTAWGKELGLEVEVRQTDDEAEMIGWMHRAVDDQTPVVMNPAAFTPLLVRPVRRRPHGDRCGAAADGGAHLQPVRP